MSNKIIKKQFVNLNPPKVFEMDTSIDSEKDNIQNLSKLKEELENQIKDYELKIKEAQNKAEEIIQKAKQEAEIAREEILSRAKEEGFDLGYDEGLKRAKEDIEQWSEKINDIIFKISENQKNILNKNKDLIAKLVKVLTKKIISVEISERSSEIAMSIIDEMSKEISGKSMIKIQISKEDYENLFEKYDLIKSKFIGADNVVIKPDMGMNAGDVFVDTEIGSYDLMIKNRIEEAFKIFDEGS